MRLYDYNPKLFADCDPHRIPYGEPGYDAYLDTPLPKLRIHLLTVPGYLENRAAILNGRLERYIYENRAAALRNEARRLRAMVKDASRLRVS